MTSPEMNSTPWTTYSGPSLSEVFATSSAKQHDKQKPVVPLYKPLLRTKKKLEKSDKFVTLEDIKLVPRMEDNQGFKFNGASEQVLLEVQHDVRSPVGKIPKALAEVCQKLLNRRVLLVELLNKVTKSEVDIGDVTGRVESLKSEAQQLQKSLEAILTGHENKIKNLVPNWQCLLNIKQSSNKASDLELKLQEEHEDASKCASRLIPSNCVKYTETTQQLTKQQDCINRYKMLLQNSENKLRSETNSMSNLQKEIMQLQVRQQVLENQNNSCLTDQLKTIIEDGRQKLNELMGRSIESERELEQNATVIKQQIRQMTQMENLLKYQENTEAELQGSNDELILHNKNLAKNSEEMRAVLIEVTKEGKMRDRLIIELQEKIDLKERQITNLEKNIRVLEANLMMANEKRFILKEAVESREKELQSTNTHFNKLTDISQRTGRQSFWNFFQVS